MDTRGGACRGRKRAGSINRASQGNWHLSDGDSAYPAVRRRERLILVAGERHSRCFPTRRQGIICPGRSALVTKAEERDRREESGKSEGKRVLTLLHRASGLAHFTRAIVRACDDAPMFRGSESVAYGDLFPS